MNVSSFAGRVALCDKLCVEFFNANKGPCTGERVHYQTRLGILLSLICLAILYHETHCDR